MAARRHLRHEFINRLTRRSDIQHTETLGGLIGQRMQALTAYGKATEATKQGRGRLISTCTQLFLYILHRACLLILGFTRQKYKIKFVQALIPGIIPISISYKLG